LKPLHKFIRDVKIALDGLEADVNPEKGKEKFEKCVNMRMCKYVNVYPKLQLDQKNACNSEKKMVKVLNTISINFRNRNQ
jgi:hypothetical protein